MYKVLCREMVVPNIHIMKIHAPHVARSSRPGQFVILMPDERGERVPLNIADWDKEEGSITVVFMEVGTSTRKLAYTNPNGYIPTCVGPLGIPSSIDRFGSVVCAGGCYGIGALFPVARALREAGNKVIAILEAKSSYLLYWENRFKSVCDELILTTEDATLGEKGHAPRILEKILKEYEVDRVFAYGCTFMMMSCSEATRPFGVKTRVSLNPIMVDGTGMCGVCRVPVGGKVRFACVDGPEFDGHEVDWEVLLSRRHSYIEEEVHSLKCYETDQFS